MTTFVPSNAHGDVRRDNNTRAQDLQSRRPPTNRHSQRSARCSPKPWLLLSLSFSALPACDEGSSARWSVVFSELDAALLSVTGTAADDVWTVGADAGDGPTILHWDGQQWERVQSSARGDLWWVSPEPETGAVWMAGDGGMVLRVAGSTSQPEVMDTPTDLRLFGIHAFAPDDVWAVGGDPSQQVGIVLHFDGETWTDVPVPDAARGASYFKVWGSDPRDVWVVGHGGVALHWNGSGFAVVPVPHGRPLLTVQGHGHDVVAVGGVGTGLIVSEARGELVDETPPGAVPQLNGTYVTSGLAVAVGLEGSILRRDDGRWSEVRDAPVISEDYHAVYVDPEDGIWAVGGDIVAPPLRNGVLTHFGARHEGTK